MTTIRMIDAQDVVDLYHLVMQQCPQKTLLQQFASQFMVRPPALLQAQINKIFHDNSHPALKFKNILIAIEMECFQNPQFINFITERELIARNLPTLQYPATLILVIAEVSNRYKFSEENEYIPKTLIHLKDVLEIINETRNLESEPNPLMVKIR